MPEQHRKDKYNRYYYKIEMRPVIIPLGNREMLVARCLKSFLDENGYPPTGVEVCEHPLLKGEGISNVHRALRILTNAGLISRRPKSSDPYYPLYGTIVPVMEETE